MASSTSSPFRVTPVVHPALPQGRLGLCPAPGRPSHSVAAGDLEADLRTLRQGAQADVLVCLLSHQELASLGLVALPERAEAHGLRWIQSPVRVGEGPVAQLEQLAATILELLKAGQNVVVHDKTGHGRSGTVIAAVLVAAGLSAERAIEVVRAAVSGAVEPGKQTSAVVEVALSLRQKKQEAAGTSRDLVALLPGATTREALFCPGEPDELLTPTSSHDRLRVHALRPGGGPSREIARRSYGACVTIGDGTWLLCPEGALSWPSENFLDVRLHGEKYLPIETPLLWTTTSRYAAFVPRTSTGHKQLVVLDRSFASFRSVEQLAEALARPPVDPIDLGSVGVDMGHPVRLVTADEGNYLAVGGAGSGLLGYSLAEQEAFAIESQLPGGHPVWVAGHPHRPLVALCSRKLEIFDLTRRVRVFQLADTIKLCGEFSPDGETFVFTSSQGILALRVNDLELRCILPPSETGGLAEEHPVRFSPDGRFLLVPCRSGIAVYPASLVSS